MITNTWHCKLVFIAVILFLANDLYGQNGIRVSGDDEILANEINHALLANATMAERYAVAVRREAFNLNPRSEDEPPSRLTQSVRVVDHFEKKSRVDYRSEQYREGSLLFSDWLAHKLERGEVFTKDVGGKDFKWRLINTEAYDPFELPLMRSFNLKSGRLKPGYSAVLTASENCVSIEKVKPGVRAEYAVGNEGRIIISFDESQGMMPTNVEWRLSNKVGGFAIVDPKTKFGVLLDKCDTKWKQIGEFWAPVFIQLNRYTSPYPNPEPIESVSFDLKWKSGESVPDDFFDYRRIESQELWETIWGEE